MSSWSTATGEVELKYVSPPVELLAAAELWRLFSTGGP